MIRLKAGFWIAVAVLVLWSAVWQVSFLHHVKYGSHLAANDLLARRLDEMVRAGQIDFTAGDIPYLGDGEVRISSLTFESPAPSDYDRGFNDALESYHSIRMEFWRRTGSELLEKIPKSGGVSYGEYHSMSRDEEYDVLRRMYGVEKAETD